MSGSNLCTAAVGYPSVYARCVCRSKKSSETVDVHFTLSFCFIRKQHDAEKKTKMAQSNIIRYFYNYEKKV